MGLTNVTYTRITSPERMNIPSHKNSESEPSTTHRTTHRMRGDHHFLALSLPAYVNFFFEIFEIIKWKTDLNPSIVVLRREK